MSTQPALWEKRLLGRALEALNSPIGDATPAALSDRERLDSAYRYCEEVTRFHSRTFHLASELLPGEKRRAARALYAFCRSTDDLVDETRDLASADHLFEMWRDRVRQVHPSAHDPIPLAWADARRRYEIPSGYADQLISGVARDRTPQRFDSFDQLADYCYGVASTVGLMAMHIIGFSHEKALTYAVKLGIALQLTNILRDVGEDMRADRCYLPHDELAEFGLTEADVAAGRVDDRWRAFMRFQIERVRRLYRNSEPGIQLLNPDGRFAITAASNLYSALLDDIERHDYDVFHRRAHLGTWAKIGRLPTIWWASRG